MHLMQCNILCNSLAILLLVFQLYVIILAAAADESTESKTNYMKTFYERISMPDVKYCSDKTRMLPDCNECIHGTKVGQSGTKCDDFITTSQLIRQEIFQLTKQRFGSKVDPQKPYGLYPYLERPEFLVRHHLFASQLNSKSNINTLIDIGPYYNPIHLFINQQLCLANVIIVEPILDPLSAMVPCSSDSSKYTHVLILPITFKYYMTIRNKLPQPDSVVCIGCDGHYGPSRRMLETAFERPYTLYIEYPSEYVHNKPFRKMVGDGDGEKMSYVKKLEIATNETVYTKRTLKVIEYKLTSLPLAQS